MSCHVLCCRVMSRHHVMSYHVMSAMSCRCHVMSDSMSCYVTSCHVMSCHLMSCHVTSRHVTSCHVMSCHVRVGPEPLSKGPFEGDFKKGLPLPQKVKAGPGVYPFQSFKAPLSPVLKGQNLKLSPCVCLRIFRKLLIFECTILS